MEIIPFFYEYLWNKYVLYIKNWQGGPAFPDGLNWVYLQITIPI